MGAAKKLASTEVVLEACVVERLLPGEPTPFLVKGGRGMFRACRAKSCLVAPEAGDKVLCAIDEESVYVLAVLASPQGASTKIATEGDLTLEAREGKVSMLGGSGVHVASPGPLGLFGAEVHVRARSGSVAVEELGFFGRVVLAEVAKVAVLAEQVDSLVTRLSLRAKRVFRAVEEIDQTRAGTVDVRAESLLGLRAETAVISARVLTKVDGEQIHIG